VWDDEDLDEARVTGAALGARPSGAAHVVYDDEEEHDEVFDEDEDADDSLDALELAADADVEDDDSAVEEDDEAAMTVVSPLIPRRRHAQALPRAGRERPQDRGARAHAP
jgi:hypothetical protein